MLLNPQNLWPGQEQYEEYQTAFVRPGRPTERVQYDYRALDGELFSCVRRTYDQCRRARDAWLAARQVARDLNPTHTMLA